MVNLQKCIFQTISSYLFASVPFSYYSNYISTPELYDKGVLPDQSFLNLGVDSPAQQKMTDIASLNRRFRR